MDGEGLLDLCHLSEVEQTMILNVLLRDAELRQNDEGRIQKLQQTVSDPVRLRSLSGAWFQEERAKRYVKGGVDVVHASLRRKRSEKDRPLKEIFYEDNGDNSCQICEQESEKNDQERDLQENINISVGDGVQEQKEEISLVPDVASEPQSRTRHITETNETIGRELEGEAVEGSEVKEMIVLPNISSSLQIDSEGDIDSGSTELKSTRFGSFSSLILQHKIKGSQMSLYSVGDFKDVVVSGRIEFSLTFDVTSEELFVRIIRCQDLASARKNRSDPYVKVYLLPDNTSRSKKKTTVRRKTLNPVYDETLKYKIRRVDLKARVLSMSVWHMERMRRNLFLGEAEVQLGQWDWSQTQSQPTWQNLQPRVKFSTEAIISRGTILFSIKFVPPGSEGRGIPETGELYIWIREITGLLPTKRGAHNTYLKSVVLPDESGISGQQTRVVRGSANPVFNHTMVYDGFQPSDLLQACAEMTVWNSQPSSCLGGVRLSTGAGVSYGQSVCWMDSTADEMNVWSSLIQSPNRWVDASLPIRPNLQLCSG